MANTYTHSLLGRCFSGKSLISAFNPLKEIFDSISLGAQTKSNGQFQKISIPYHGRLPYFKSPLPSEFPKCVIPPCPQISVIVNPHPVRIFHFFVKPFGITTGFTNMPNLAYFMENYFKWLYFCSVQLVIEGVIMTREILEWKFKKN